MGNSLLGNVVFFWVFILGGMFIGRVLGLLQSNKEIVVFIIILTFFYWGLAFIRFQWKQRKGEGNK